MNVPADGDGVEDVEVAGGQARQAEQRQPSGKLEQGRLVFEAPAGVDQPLGRARRPDPAPQPPPQLGPATRRSDGRRRSLGHDRDISGRWTL